MNVAEDPGGATAASLTRAVLDEESERLDKQAAAAEARVLDDEALPGVGDEEVTLRESLKIGGSSILAVLSALAVVDQFVTGGLSILAPDIQNTLRASDAVIAVSTVSGTLLMVVGGLVLGRLADSKSRTAIIGISTIAWGTVLLATAMVTNALLYFCANAVMGFGRSNTTVVQTPVLADAYPIGSRGRIYGVQQVAARFGGLALPIGLGAMVTLIGGPGAWRWGFVAMSVPTVTFGAVALLLRDPPRGQFEQVSTIGQVVDTAGGPPMSIGVTYQRILKIRTFKTALIAFSALGFSWVSIPVFVSLYLDHHFHLDAFGISLVTVVPGVLGLVVVPLVAQRFDAFYRKSPPLTLTFVGALFLPAGVLVPIQMAMPNVWLFAGVAAVGGVILGAQLAMLYPILANVTPYYLRGQGTAIGMAIVLGVGGFGGALLGGLISDSFGLATAIVAVAVPSNIIGGLALMNGSRFLRNDLSTIVEEIREIEAEDQRLKANPDDLPVLQLRNIDFAYGPVQVLFDVNLDVRRGETLALLGTNGAGKSTVLKVISGLGVSSRGVVRLNGHTMTLCSPETRVRWGIHQLPGGKSVFLPMSVRENLEMAGFLYRNEAATRRGRQQRVLDIFPELADRLDQQAGTLSGGQQQMLGLAMALMHDPEILLIDELSLGLAPIMVERLLAVVERLKAAGQTMIIVEQSLNVALAIADRAVFMEKGRIRFEGLAGDLLARDDLVRAVFLGSAPA